VTHRLMVMHIRTICSWTVLLDLFELFDLEVKGQGPTNVITVRDTPPYVHAPTYQLSLTYLERQKSYGLDKLRWEEAEAEEAEAEEKIRQTMSPFVRRGDIIKTKYSWMCITGCYGDNIVTY
jgi:hypothetical protein